MGSGNKSKCGGSQIPSRQSAIRSTCPNSSTGSMVLAVSHSDGKMDFKNMQHGNKTYIYISGKLLITFWGRNFISWLLGSNYFFHFSSQGVIYTHASLTYLWNSTVPNTYLKLIMGCQWYVHVRLHGFMYIETFFYLLTDLCLLYIHITDIPVYHKLMG